MKLSEIMNKSFAKAAEDIGRYLKSNPTSRSTQSGDEIKLLEKREADRQSRSAHPPVSAAKPDQRPITTRRMAREVPSSSTPPTATRIRAEEASDDLPSERRSLRLSRTRDASVRPSPVLWRWTEQNPSWAETWRMPLVYRRTTVDQNDIPRLDEGQCLNDNIIGFYLQYLLSDLESSRPKVARRLYFHNTFFYDKLKPTRGRGINYEGVRTWTAKVDLFSYDYIVVPVNEHYHWWVAIICNPGKMDPTVACTSDPHEDEDENAVEVEADDAGNEQATPRTRERHVIDVDGRQPLEDGEREARLDDQDRMSVDTIAESDKAATGANKGRAVEAVNLDQDDIQVPNKTSPHKGKRSGKKVSGPGPRKYNPEDPRIITLDSLGTSHSPACTHLKQYLIAEFKDKKGRDIDYSQPIGMKATNIPEQNNFCDCGVYLLGYIQEFLKDPDTFVQTILRREQKEWVFDASETRNDLRKLVFNLHDQYQNEQERLRHRKAKAKRAKQASSPTVPVNGTEPGPQRAMEGHSRPVSSQPGSSAVSPPSVTSPDSDSEDVQARLGRSDTRESSRPRATDDRSSGPTAPRAVAPAVANVDHGSRGTQGSLASRPESRSSSTSPEPLPSVEVVDSIETVAPQARRPALSPAPKPHARQPVLIEKSDDDVEFLRPITSSSPAAASRVRDRSRHTSMANSSSRPQGRSGGESGARGSSSDLYEVPSSPSQLDEGHGRFRMRQSHSHQSSYFSSPGAVAVRGSRSLPHRDHAIDLTDD